jgi:hypothetical protein
MQTRKRKAEGQAAYISTDEVVAEHERERLRKIQKESQTYIYITHCLAASIPEVKYETKAYFSYVPAGDVFPFPPKKNPQLELALLPDLLIEALNICSFTSNV